MEITKENIKELVGRRIKHNTDAWTMEVTKANKKRITFKPIKGLKCDSSEFNYDTDFVLGRFEIRAWILLPKPPSKKDTTPTHYDNTNGSLYLFAEQHGLNAWEFEVIKRTVRCRKKGEFISDIEKTIEVLKLYLKEQGHKYDGQVEKLNK